MIAEAQAMSPEERMTGGFRLFEMEKRVVRHAIRLVFPEATEDFVETFLREHIERLRDLEREADRGIDLPPR
jgi:hypothetical protein